jgi:preprotein translocase subunit SecG
MLEGFLYAIHIVVCLAMLPIILLQAGKGGGVSAAFGGGGSGSVLGGSRGASTFLTKLTSGAAIVFMLTSLGLAYTSSQSRSVVGDVPPVEGSPGTAPIAEPGAPGATAPTSTPAAP